MFDGLNGIAPRSHGRIGRRGDGLYHNAGAGGWGGSSYIDLVILRDRDANSGWTAAADGTLEERRYYCQNWRADVSVILKSTGYFVERVKYSAYGTPFGLPAGDTDSDGDCDATDAGLFYPTSYDVRFDLDGDNDATDYADTLALSGTTLGRGKLSRTDTANRKGYAGYENDGNLVRFYHVRHRVLDTLLGRWINRDSVGYLDGDNLYQYARSQPAGGTDPSGLRLEPEGDCSVTYSYALAGSGGPGGGCQPRQPDEPEGISFDDCNSCRQAAERDPRVLALKTEIRRRGCRVPTITCRQTSTCRATGWGGYYDGGNHTIWICPDNISSCDRVIELVLHELYHAFQRCRGESSGSCCDCLCFEMRGYRFEGGCEDGGTLRPPHPSEQACLEYWSLYSCRAECQDEETIEVLECLERAVRSCFPVSD